MQQRQHHTKLFPVEPLREPCASFHSIHCRSLSTQSAKAEILDGLVSQSTRSAARKQLDLVRPSQFWQLKTCYNRTE
jgi:hypothetical protein